MTPGVKFDGKNCFAVLSTLSCTSTWWLDFFKHVINKLLHVKSLISFLFTRF